MKNKAEFLRAKAFAENIGLLDGDLSTPAKPLEIIDLPPWPWLEIPKNRSIIRAALVSMDRPQCRFGPWRRPKH